jgi:hypothetical protein
MLRLWWECDAACECPQQWSGCRDAACCVSTLHDSSPPHGVWWKSVGSGESNCSAACSWGNFIRVDLASAGDGGQVVANLRRVGSIHPRFDARAGSHLIRSPQRSTSRGGISSRCSSRALHPALLDPLKNACLGVTATSERMHSARAYSFSGNYHSYEDQ